MNFFKISFPWAVPEEEQRNDAIVDYWREAISRFNLLHINGECYVIYEGIRITTDSDTGDMAERLRILRENYVKDKFKQNYGEEIELHHNTWRSPTFRT